MRAGRSLRAVVVVFALAPSAARAVDQPIDGARLVLRRSGATEKLVFVSHDAKVLFPAAGSADDPATGASGGVRIDLVSTSGDQATLTAPPIALAWTAPRGRVAVHRFVNPSAPGGISPVRLVVLREGRLLRIVARAIGLSLAAPQGRVTIRISIGSLRSCALFGGSTIRRDRPGTFLAAGASSAALADCADATLGLPPTTSTTSSSTSSTSHASTSSTTATTLAALACGDTFPTCGGTCPYPFFCAPSGSGCACNVPTCVGSSFCGGTCPPGLSCVPRGGPGGLLFCNCIDYRCGSPDLPTCASGLCPSGGTCADVGGTCRCVP